MAYQDGSVYFGEFKHGQRSGKGWHISKPADAELAKNEKHKEWFGEWKHDKVWDYDKKGN